MAVAAWLVAFSAQAANRGSCVGDAVQINASVREQTKAVAVTEEYNPEWDNPYYTDHPRPDGWDNPYRFSRREITTNGTVVVTNAIYDVVRYAYYYRVTLNRSKAYSFWVDGDLPENPVKLASIEPREATQESEFEPGALFDEYSGKWGSMMVMPADSWFVDPDDPEMSDPPKWDYLVCLTATNANAQATLHWQIGNALPVGTDDNPLPLGVSSGERTDGPRTFVKNEYSFKYQVNFTDGRRYHFATLGGTSNNVYSISVHAAGKAFDFADWASPYNDSISFDSAEGGSAIVEVRASDTNATEMSSFRLRCGMVPAHSISQHQADDIPVGTNGVTFAPGRLSTGGNAYFDGIIDERLFAFDAAKGEKYVAETRGAVTNLLMRIYDSKGNRLYERKNRGDGSYDVRCGFSPEKSERLYVGICQDMDDYDRETPLGSNVTLTVETLLPREGEPDRWDFADDDYLGATPLCPVPAISNAHPVSVDLAVSNDWHRLDKHDWYDTFAINGREGFAYALAVTNRDMDAVYNSLAARVYYMNGSREVSVSTDGTIRPGHTNALTFVAKRDTTYYLRLSVQGAVGANHPDYRVHSTVFDAKTGLPPAVGTVTAEVIGCDAGRWMLEGDDKKYAYRGGVPLQVKPGRYTVKFTDVSGFKTPSSVSVDVKEGATVSAGTGRYSDEYDPEDDTAAGAVAWTVQSTAGNRSRSLWAGDPADHFVVTDKGKGKTFYNFEITRNLGKADAVFTVVDANGTTVAENVTSLSRVKLAKGKNLIAVSHRNPAEPLDTYYTISGVLADVGEVGFAKQAVKAKRASGSVALTVKRTSADGRIRVKYETEAGTARPGEHYITQNGVLEWASGDKNPKTITITIIPDLFAGDGSVTDFKVRLLPVNEADLVKDEYPAQISIGECTVTVTDSKGKGKEELYAAKKAKVATAKEVSEPLTVGNFCGVLSAQVDSESARTNETDFAGILTNGLPQLASVSFTATSADKLSAKVTVAGKKYSLKDGSWVAETNGYRICRLEASGIALELALAGGQAPADWKTAGGAAVLTMDVPDAKKGGKQLGIAYRGEVFRDNSKVQAYYDEIAAQFAGYYTVALKPAAVEYSGGMPLAPAGNGYIGITIDNKGKAKLAGKLADGTKISQSANACAIRYDGAAGAPALYIPVYASKKSYCFGGTLRLYRKTIDVKKPDGTMANLDPFRADFDTVVDSSTNTVGNLVWNNDDATLSYEGLSGWQLSVVPVGGWYDTVFNLQAYYKAYALQLDAPLIEAFPAQDLPEGFAFVDIENTQPKNVPVAFAGNTIAVPKKKIAKESGVVNFQDSVNPCELKIKFKRATGVLSGSFKLWAESEAVQKTVGSVKHEGILLLQRDGSGALEDSVLSAGFINYATKVSRDVDYDAKTGKYKARKWTLSLPFNLRGEDQSTGE